MAILDLLGRRWSMRILWELSVSPGTFRELQSRCDQLSASVLNTRLSDLKQAHLVCIDSVGYRLTESGQELMACIAPLRKWAEKWGGKFNG